MDKKTYKAIKQKIINNVEIIYENSVIKKELKNFFEKYPSLEVLQEEAERAGAFTGSMAYVDGVGEIELDPISSLHDYIGLMLHGDLVADFYGDKYPYTEETELLKKIIQEKNNPIDNVCKKLKINPLIWRDVVIAKFLNIPKDTILSFMDDIINNYYLPKIKIEKDKIIIEINELTTIDDLKAVSNEINRTQKIFEKKYKYVNQKRKIKNLKNDKEIVKLLDKGLKRKEVVKKYNQSKTDMKDVIDDNDVGVRKNQFNKKFRLR